VSLLLDTHALLWWLSDDPALKAEAREAIVEASTIIYISAATAGKSASKKRSQSSTRRTTSMPRFLPTTSKHYRSHSTMPPALDSCRVTMTIHSIEC
jgi:hypothetical protein